MPGEDGQTGTLASNHTNNTVSKSTDLLGRNGKFTSQREEREGGIQIGQNTGGILWLITERNTPLLLPPPTPPHYPREQEASPTVASHHDNQRPFCTMTIKDPSVQTLVSSLPG